MKKSMIGTIAAMMVFNGSLYAEDLVRVGSDGYSVIYMPKDFENNPEKISNDAGCFVSSAFIPGYASGSNDAEREANKNSAINQALLQQANEVSHKAICPIVTLNGVTVQVKNVERYKLFPLSFSGWVFDISKSANTDFLKRIEKISQATRIDKNVLFLKWFIHRSTVSAAVDNIGEFVVDEQQLQIGADAITRSFLLQKLAMDGDANFEELKKAFERDIIKGWSPDHKTKGFVERINSQPSWFECRQEGPKIKAVADVPSDQIISYVKKQSNSENKRLYISLSVKEVKNKPITAEDGIGGMKLDESYFTDPIKDEYDSKTDKWIVPQRSLAWSYYTTAEHDPSLLWISNRTFADDPMKCERLAPVGKTNYFADPSTTSTHDKAVGEWVINPINGCASAIEIGKLSFRENKEFGLKSMNIVRGENIRERGVVAFGDGLTPKVFYAANSQVCEQLKKDGGLKIGKWFFQNRTAESQKADSIERDNKLVNQYFPNGLWVSDHTGSCNLIEKSELIKMAKEIDVKNKPKEWVDACEYDLPFNGKTLSGKLTQEEYSGGKIFATALATFATGGAALFVADKKDLKNQTNYVLRDCVKATRNDDGSDSNEFTKRNMTFAASTKTQCEYIAKSQKMLHEDEFKKQFLREVEKGK